MGWLDKPLVTTLTQLKDSVTANSRLNRTTRRADKA